LFEGKGFKKALKNEVRLLEPATDKEIMLFAKLKGLKFRPKKKDKGVQELLDKMSAKHPGARFALLRNIKELSNVK